MQGDNLASDDHVVSGLCHYPGQGQPASGLERGAMEISERTLRDVFLPSWEAGIKKCGALGVMATYPAIDGIPTHASKKLLTRILRDEFHFDGLVLSEGGGIGTIVSEAMAATQKEAGIIALAAGLDVGISYESGYMLDLLASVREGKVPMDQIDRSTARILKQKFRLGLFEKPLVDVEKAVATVHQPAHQEIALQAAREAIVLLKNDKGLLPLKKTLKSVAVIGPNADNGFNQTGDYTPRKVLQHVVTVLEGVKQIVSPDTKVTYVQGCDVTGTDPNTIAEAKEAAAKAEVAIVVLGERHNGGGGGKASTDGEGSDSATLELTGLQEELVKAVQSTGTPTVVVLINGRALATRWVAENVPAVVEAWLPGEKGGQAVAEVLFGDTNPSGKLSVTVPRHAGQLPVYYNYKKSKRAWLREGRRQYVDMPASPLYPFGHGLSYTRFEYSDLKLSSREIAPTDSVELVLQVKNAGDRPGKETVQLYIEDVISSVSTPVKQLKGFAKLALEPGETKSCSFKLTPDDLALYDADLRRVVEPGQFRVMIGSSSEDIRQRSDFWVK